MLIKIIGRVDKTSFHVAKGISEYFCKIQSNITFEHVPLLAVEWNKYKRDLQNKRKDYPKAAVFSFFHEENFEFFGSANDLRLWASKNHGYVDKTKLSMLEKVTRHRYKKFLESRGNSQVFLEFSHGKEHLGRVDLELYNDKCPLSVENFLLLCTPPEPQDASLKNCRVHRSNKMFLQSGDVVDGSGNNSVQVVLPKQKKFVERGFDFPDLGIGVIGYVTRTPNENGSQFFITLEASPWMKSKFRCFGRVCSGMRVLKIIKDIEVNECERPIVPLRISNCGILYQTPEQISKRSEMKRRRQEERSIETRRRKVSRLLKEEFNIIDENNDGFLTLDELRKSLEELYEKSVPENEVQMVLNQLDTNEDDAISEKEYVQSMFTFLTLDEMEKEFEHIKHRRMQMEIEKRKLAFVKGELSKSFRNRDLNENGYIDLDEVFYCLQMLLGEIPTDTDIEKFIKFFTSNKSDGISEREYVGKMMELYTLDEHITMIEDKIEKERVRAEKQKEKCMRQLERSFQQVDEDQNGYIDSTELKRAMEFIDGSAISDEEAKSALEAMDTDDDGLISKKEYVDALLRSFPVEELIQELKNQNKKIEEEQIRERKMYLVRFHLNLLFENVEYDARGFIDPNDLAIMLKLWTGMDPPFKDVKQLYWEIDVDRSGRVDKPEFVKAMMTFFSVDENIQFIEEMEERIRREDEESLTQMGKDNRRSRSKEYNMVVRELGKIFHKIDDDWSGSIEKKELAKTLEYLLGKTPTQAQVDSFFKHFDEDEDDNIEKSEFIKGMFNMFEFGELVEALKPQDTTTK